MAENVTTTGRSKHIDIKTRWITKACEDGFFKLVFVKSEDNRSDIFTKNVSNDIHQRHLDTYVSRKEYLLDESNAPQDDNTD